MVETNQVTLFHTLNERDKLLNNEFTVEVQRVRPISDVCYIPMRIAGSLVGYFALGRAGLNSDVYSENDVEIFSFISSFLEEGFKRTLHNCPEEENVAVLNARGEVLSAGKGIRCAFTDLFGRRFSEIPGNGLSENSLLFRDKMNRFLKFRDSPGDGSLILHKSGIRYDFSFKLLPDLFYRPYYPEDPQFTVTMRNSGISRKMNDIIDFDRVNKTFSFTIREMDVIRCIFRGMSNREIACHLTISESTVKRHIWNVFNKAGVDSRTQLVFTISS